MDFSRAVSEALSGNACLFLGAGFSFGCTTIENTEILGSKKLAHKLCEDAGISPIENLSDAAEEFIQINQGNEDSLVAKLKNYFTIKEIKSFHQKIASIPWRRVYTTNYDNAFELAMRKSSKNYSSVVLNDDPMQISTKTTTILHINGYIEKLVKSSLFKEFKLTDTSYLTADFMNSKWIHKFTFDIESSSAFFFLGYSLYDIDIKRMLASFSPIKERIFILPGDDIEPREERSLARFGNVQLMTAEQFSNSMSVSRTGVVPLHSGEHFFAFNKIERECYSESPIPVTAEHLYRLFVLGDIDTDVLFHDITSGEESRYFLKRTELNSIMKSFNSKIGRSFAVQSSLGNGKTLLFEGVKALCAKNGISCYEYKEYSDTIDREMQEILAHDEPQFVLIENISKNYSVIEKLFLHKKSTTIIVFSSRDDMLDSGKYSFLNDYDYEILSIDRIGDELIHNISNILTNNGLWGEYSSLTATEKELRLTRTNKSSFASILIDLIKSKDISKRLNDLCSVFLRNSSERKIITISILLNLVDANVNLQTIIPTFKLTDFRQRDVVNSEIFKQLFCKDNFSLKAKSNVLSRYIIQEITPANYVVDVLIEIYETCSTLVDDYKWARFVVNQLDLFSVIQYILPSEGKLHETKRYFDRIRESNGNSSNFHFWLQYAISMTVQKEFDFAETLFDTAYSLFGDAPRNKRRNLDNHYGRFLMLKEIYASTATFSFSLFKKANEIVLEQIAASGTYHFPYRIALLYLDYYKKSYLLLSDDEKDFIRKQALIILEKIRRLSDVKMISNRYVDEAKRNLNTLLRMMEQKRN